MVIFHCYVSSPEGKGNHPKWLTCSGWWHMVFYSGTRGMSELKPNPSEFCNDRSCHGHAVWVNKASTGGHLWLLWDKTGRCPHIFLLVFLVLVVGMNIPTLSMFLLTLLLLFLLSLFCLFFFLLLLLFFLFLFLLLLLLLLLLVVVVVVLLAIGHWLLAVGCWPWVGCWSLVVGCSCCSPLAAGCWLLAVGCLLLVGCWLLFMLVVVAAVAVAVAWRF